MNEKAAAMNTLLEALNLHAEEFKQDFLCIFVDEGGFEMAGSIDANDIVPLLNKVSTKLASGSVQEVCPHCGEETQHDLTKPH